uniref:Uncharacterized protein n=1 Tax=Tanacetum cinerariifolium TaxID=118510 RepID=A0A699HXK5_TANCI|nr:hypothetical protein [Tanacetum cinerariifolium]
MASGRGRLKVDLEPSMWRRRQEYKATPSQRYLYIYKTDFKVLTNYKEDYQGDAQEDKLTNTTMLLAGSITQKFSTLTNNRLRTSSNTRNQAVIHDGRFDIQTKNACYGGNGNGNVGRQNMNQAANAGNGQGKKLLAMKDEAGGTLNDKENDFMLDNAFGDETLEELIDVVIIMACI